MVATIPAARVRETGAMKVTLLGRAGCHLCAVAHADLLRICGEFGVGVDVIDVDERAQADPSLRAEFGDRVPVVLLDGVEHSYFDVDEPRLRADLSARRGL